MVVLENLSKMSWAKASVEAGLAGLSEREAARGALCEEAFQLIPSPNVMLRPVVSKFKCRLILTNLTCVECRDVKDAYSIIVYLIQKEEKDDDWLKDVPDPQKRQRQQKPFLVVS